MTVIRVPRTPASAMNPDRPVGKLLRNQLVHLQEAEFRLPANQQTNIYINKIKTEGEAAEYIPRVERGYIVGGGPSFVDGFGYVDIVNYGKTAAILTKVEWGFCEEKDFPVDAPVSALLKTGRLKVDDCRITEDVLPPNRPPGHLQDTKFLISKALGKIFYGKFTYSILFDSDEHFSTFKLRFIPRDGSYFTVGLPGSYSDWK